MSIDKSLIARVSQLAAASTQQRPVHELIVEALRERFAGDPEGLLNFAAQAMGGIAKTIRVRSYDLPEQGTLFDLPHSIVITSPLGEVLLQNDEATAGQVDQWLTEGEQHHGSQHRRFKERRKAFKAASLDPSRNYMEQLRELRGDK